MAQAIYATMPQYNGAATVAFIELERENQATAEAQQKALQGMQNMLDSMQGFVEADASASFEDWVATAKDYGIADFKRSLVDVGLTEEAVEGQFDMLKTQIAATQEQKHKETEEQFWVDSIVSMESIDENVDNVNEHLSNIFTIMEKHLDVTSKIHSVFTTFLSEWEDYFIRHTVYNSAYTADTVDKILRTERENSETAIYALADALTGNDVKLLLDPTVQTNALLGQILKVANAILNQQSSGAGGVSLPDTIAGLSLGIVQ